MVILLEPKGTNVQYKDGGEGGNAFTWMREKLKYMCAARAQHMRRSIEIAAALNRPLLHGGAIRDIGRVHERLIEWERMGCGV